MGMSNNNDRVRAIGRICDSNSSDNTANEKEKLAEDDSNDNNNDKIMIIMAQ